MKFDLYIGDETVPCEELTVSLYKNLLKTTYGDEPDMKRFVGTVCDVFATLTNKPVSYFQNISIVELMSCIFQLRMFSVGDRTSINLSNDKAKQSLELRLDWVNDDLLEFDKKIITKTLSLGPVSIQMSSPSVMRLLEKTEDDYLYFVNTVKVGSKEVVLRTNLEAKEITDALPIKNTLMIVEHFESIIEKLKSLNFLARYKITDRAVGFIPSVESLLWFTKLIFNEPLQTFYDNVFYLAKFSNIPPTYTEACTVGDYFVYVGILQSSLAQQRSEQSPSEDNVDL